MVLRSLPTFFRNIPINDGSDAGDGAGNDVLLVTGPDTLGGAVASVAALFIVGVVGSIMVSTENRAEAS
jgi:hypothetical protein